MNKEDTYLKDSIVKCVDYAMKQDDENKRRIFTGLFKYCDRLVNEDILVKALNDEEKKKWFDNEMLKAKDNIIDNLQVRIDKAIEYIEEYKRLNWYEDSKHFYNVLDILKGSDKE